MAEAARVIVSHEAPMVALKSLFSEGFSQWGTGGSGDVDGDDDGDGGCSGDGGSGNGCCSGGSGSFLDFAVVLFLLVFFFSLLFSLFQ